MTPSLSVCFPPPMKPKSSTSEQKVIRASHCFRRSFEEKHKHRKVPRKIQPEQAWRDTCRIILQAFPTWQETSDAHFNSWAKRLEKHQHIWRFVSWSYNSISLRNTHSNRMNPMRINPNRWLKSLIPKVSKMMSKHWHNPITRIHNRSSAQYALTWVSTIRANMHLQY